MKKSSTFYYDTSQLITTFDLKPLWRETDSQIGSAFNMELLYHSNGYDATLLNIFQWKLPTMNYFHIYVNFDNQNAFC